DNGRVLYLHLQHHQPVFCRVCCPPSTNARERAPREIQLVSGRVGNKRSGSRSDADSSRRSALIIIARCCRASSMRASSSPSDISSNLESVISNSLGNVAETIFRYSTGRSIRARRITSVPCSSKSFASSSRNIVPIRSLTPFLRPPVFVRPFSNRLIVPSDVPDRFRCRSCNPRMAALLRGLRETQTNRRNVTQKLAQDSRLMWGLCRHPRDGKTHGRRSGLQIRRYLLGFRGGNCTMIGIL